MTGGRDERNEPGGRSYELGRRRQPRWMTFFTILMFLLGANMFVSSIDDLYRLATRKPKIINLDGVGDAQREAILRQTVLDNELLRHQPRVMAVQTSGRLILALAYLFAVAAVVARDARGRRAWTLAGWLGLVHWMANAMFLVLWVRQALPWVLPKLTQALADEAVRMGRPISPPNVVAEQARLFLIAGPVTLCGLGMVLSLVLLAYFSGRRMRSFYEQLGQHHG